MCEQVYKKNTHYHAIIKTRNCNTIHKVSLLSLCTPIVKRVCPECACQYLTLVGELCGGDVQLLKLLLELGEVGLQPGVLQLGLIQLALELLVIRCQRLVVIEKLTVCLVQP